MKDIKKIYEKLNKQLKNYTIPIEENIDFKTKKPFFILVAILLSSRTKDSTTKKVIDNLFKEIRNINDLVKIDLKKLEQLLYGVGFYKTKARNLKKLAKIIIKDYNRKIPNNLEDLEKLPGIGRKTANLILSKAFNKDTIAVDIHVFRIANRIGVVNSKTPKETETKLKEIIDKRLWRKTNSLFVKHGQNICTPINPYCSKCSLEEFCEKKNVKKSR